MPGLSYPFVFEYDNYSAETTVERCDARDLFSLDPDSMTAVDVVLESRGWLQTQDEIFCSDFTSEAE